MGRDRGQWKKVAEQGNPQKRQMNRLDGELFMKRGERRPMTFTIKVKLYGQSESLRENTTSIVTRTLHQCVNYIKHRIITNYDYISQILC